MGYSKQELFYILTPPSVNITATDTTHISYFQNWKNVQVIKRGFNAYGVFDYGEDKSVINFRGEPEIRSPGPRCLCCVGSAISIMIAVCPLPI